MVLVMLGEGEAYYQGKRLKGIEAMKEQKFQQWN